MQKMGLCTEERIETVREHAFLRKDGKKSSLISVLAS